MEHTNGSMLLIRDLEAQPLSRDQWQLLSKFTASGWVAIDRVANSLCWSGERLSSGLNELLRRGLVERKPELPDYRLTIAGLQAMTLTSPETVVHDRLSAFKPPLDRTPLTGYGQIQKGDSLIVEYLGVDRAHTVEEVLDPGTDFEEVILNRRTNLYFITSTVIDGTSWASNVRIKSSAAAVELVSVPSFDRLPNVIHLDDRGDRVMHYAHSVPDQIPSSAVCYVRADQIQQAIESALIANFCSDAISADALSEQISELIAALVQGNAPDCALDNESEGVSDE